MSTTTKAASAGAGLSNMSRQELETHCLALRAALYDCDWTVHELTSGIASMSNAALQLLALDPQALRNVAGLLALMGERADYLADFVDSTASDCGCSAVEACSGPGSPAAAYARIAQQWRELQAGPGGDTAADNRDTLARASGQTA